MRKSFLLFPLAGLAQLFAQNKISDLGENEMNSHIKVVLKMKKISAIFMVNLLSMVNRLSLGVVTLLVAASITSHAQNKTLGVGTATPNANAALHVESPTNNQGLLIPRLTSVQRINMTLGPADIGMLVYDITLNSVHTWDGSAWSDASMSEIAQKLALPYSDTVTNAPINTNLFRIINTGTVAGGVGVAHFENLNVNSNFTTLFVRNAGTNSAGYFQMLTNTAPSAALRGITNSNAVGGHGVSGSTTGIGGSAGYFQLTNAASTLPSLQGITNGLGAGVQGQNIGTGNGFGGLFSVTEPTNTFPAVQANSKGTGSAIRAFQSATDGTGPGMDVFMLNTASTSPGFAINSSHLGRGVDIVMSNVSSTAAGLNIAQDGNGYALYSKTTGTNENAYFEVANAASSGSPVVGITSGTGVAGFFRVTNASNGGTAVFGSTNSNLGGATAPGGVVGISTGTGSVGGAFRVSNTASTFPALYTQTIGLSNSIVSKIVNASNSLPSLYAETNGTGAAIEGKQIGTGYGVYATSKNTDAIYATKLGGDGIGSAGNFQNSEPTNVASTLFSMTNAAGGPALGLMNTANGNALAIFQGGVQLSALTVSVAGTITAKAGLYEITTTGTFTLPVSGSVGETCLVSNATGSAITVVNPSDVAAGTVRQFIRLTGGWKIVN